MLALAATQTGGSNAAIPHPVAADSSRAFRRVLGCRPEWIKQHGRSVATKQEPCFRIVAQLSRYESDLQFRYDGVGGLVDREELVRHGEPVALLLTHRHDKLCEVGVVHVYTHAVSVGEFVRQRFLYGVELLLGDCHQINRAVSCQGRYLG